MRMVDMDRVSEEWLFFCISSPDKTNQCLVSGGGGGYVGYDHYAYYTQQQQQMQYYENLRRTNPQAYAEWYRKYYMQAAAAGAVPGAIPGAAVLAGGAAVGGAMMMGQSELPTDGRESVHSGRSSTNDKDR